MNQTDPAFRVLVNPTEVHGNRTPAENAGNSRGSLPSGAEYGARGAQNSPRDPDLQAVIDAWPALPADVRAGIVALVNGSFRRESQPVVNGAIGNES